MFVILGRHTLYSVTAGLFDYNLQVEKGNPCTSHLTSYVVWDWAKVLLGKLMKVLPLPFLVTIFKFRNFALKRCSCTSKLLFV